MSLDRYPTWKSELCMSPLFPPFQQTKISTHDRTFSDPKFDPILSFHEKNRNHVSISFSLFNPRSRDSPFHSKSLPQDSYSRVIGGKIVEKSWTNRIAGDAFSKTGDILYRERGEGRRGEISPVQLYLDANDPAELAAAD